MDELEVLIEELEAEAANAQDATGVPDAHIARLLAVAHSCYGDFGLAVPHARTALAEGGPDAEMSFALGLAAEYAGDQELALTEYEACLETDAKFWRAMFHVAKIALSYGFTDTGVDYLRQCAEINPAHAPTKAFLSRLEEAGGVDALKTEEEEENGR